MDILQLACVLAVNEAEKLRNTELQLQKWLLTSTLLTRKRRRWRPRQGMHSKELSWSAREDQEWQSLHGVQSNYRLVSLENWRSVQSRLSYFPKVGTSSNDLLW